MPRPGCLRISRHITGETKDGFAEIGPARECGLMTLMLNVELIEDDPALRALLVEWLAGDGYRVRAGVGIRSAAGGIDAVVVDLPELPMQGAETIRNLKSLYAGAAVIGLSTQAGAASSGDSRQARALGLARLVAKPCSRRELLAAVAGAIGGGS